MADTAELMSHVQDTDAFHFPFGISWQVPQPFEALGVPLHVTKFMFLEVVAAVLMIVVFVPLARRIARGDAPRGRYWNFFETMLVFIRDEVARPAVGHHDAHRFLPYLWTVFFFILFCNLLGMLPWCGSPTGSLSVTGALAVIAFITVVSSGMLKIGPLAFWKSMVPPMDLPGPMGLILVPFMFVIEFFGLLIKHFVLAVRLLANMFAGHLVLAVIVAFIADVAHTYLWYAVMPASIFGAVSLSLLELFVAFLQAYIFTFLSALFVGMALHPH
jgi:F-type H+-transporting ATPase subunit a